MLKIKINEFMIVCMLYHAIYVTFLGNRRHDTFLFIKGCVIIFFSFLCLISNLDLSLELFITPWRHTTYILAIWFDLECWSTSKMGNRILVFLGRFAIFFTYGQNQGKLLVTFRKAIVRCTGKYIFFDIYDNW